MCISYEICIVFSFSYIFFFKQKTAYEMRISDWSSDVCSSDLVLRTDPLTGATSHLLTIEIERRRNPVSLERILRIADGDASARFMINRKSGKSALRTREIGRAHV